jgi:hypothetical protein
VDLNEGRSLILDQLPEFEVRELREGLVQELRLESVHNEELLVLHLLVHNEVLERRLEVQEHRLALVHTAELLVLHLLVHNEVLEHRLEVQEHRLASVHTAELLVLQFLHWQQQVLAQMQRKTLTKN